VDSYNNITRDTSHASGGLVLTDVNFDGRDDLLIFQEAAGSQAAAIYNCFLRQSNGKYKRCENFEEILNPSLDTAGKKVLGTTCNWAASHSWMMYEYRSGAFVITAILTEEPDEARNVREDGTSPLPEDDDFYWKRTISNQMANGKWKSKAYSTADYTDEQWAKMFNDPTSEWALESDKWRTLSNNGTRADGSIYGSAPDAMILRIITD
jgi:uncharacterized protein YegJ (DUF2314 family)